MVGITHKIENDLDGKEIIIPAAAIFIVVSDGRDGRQRGYAILPISSLYIH